MESDLVKVLKNRRRVTRDYESPIINMIKKTLKIIMIIILAIILVLSVLITLESYYWRNNKIEYTDKKFYESYRNDDLVFTNDMREIWPRKVKEEEVKEFYLMTYYSDATAFTGYLIVEYEPDEYKNEIERLRNIDSDNYIGIYDASGFEQYELLSMRASKDSSRENGFTYALTDGKQQVIYIELEFPNIAREDYKKIISEKYLPDGLKME